MKQSFNDPILQALENDVASTAVQLGFTLVVSGQIDDRDYSIRDSGGNLVAWSPRIEAIEMFLLGYQKGREA